MSTLTGIHGLAVSHCSGGIGSAWGNNKSFSCGTFWGDDARVFGGTGKSFGCVVSVELYIYKRTILTHM